MLLSIKLGIKLKPGVPGAKNAVFDKYLNIDNPSLAEAR